MFRSVIYVKYITYNGIEVNYKYKMINYTYNNVSYNTKIPFTNEDIYESYDGTNIVVFNWNNCWYYSTSKCLNMFESNFNSTISFGDMFLEALNN